MKREGSKKVAMDRLINQIYLDTKREERRRDIFERVLLEMDKNLPDTFPNVIAFKAKEGSGGSN